MASPAFVMRGDVLPWGRVHRRPQRIAAPRFCDQLPALINDGEASDRLAIGLRRSYGDSCLNSDGAMIDMSGLDRFIAFDAASGTLRAEAGASLSQILALTVPRGWFLPTTPGTRFVTLGGAVANDVHGKNHHRAGSFGCHVRSLGLLRTDGARRAITPEDDRGLFEATIGGLGLTGVIEWVEIDLARIPSAYLDVETIPYLDLQEFWALAAESVEKFEHTVSWIDCGARGAKFGRGIFSRANWRDDRVFDLHSDRASKSVAFDASAILLNSFSVAAFNEIYFRANKMKSGRHVQHYAPFFFPLDAILNWNKLYGNRGMHQYQCVIPTRDARAAISSLSMKSPGRGRRRSSRCSRLSARGRLQVFCPFRVRAPPWRSIFPTAVWKLCVYWLVSMRSSARLRARSTQPRTAASRLDVFRRSFPRWREFLEYKDPNMNSDFWRRVAG